MENSEYTHLSLNELEEALKKLISSSSHKSQNLGDFYSNVVAHFPQVSIEENESLWDDEPTSEGILSPVWWDELDEPFELDEMHWLVSIQKYKLLSHDDVINTLNAIEAGVLAEDVLNRQLQGFDLNKYDKSELKKVTRIGHEAFDRMLVHNLKLGLQIARSYTKRVDLQDAFAFTVFGLMQAIRKFDWRLGNQFSTYATFWIKQSISREIAECSTTIRIPVHAFDRMNTFHREIKNLRKKEYTTAGDVTIKDKSGNILGIYPPLPPLSIELEIDTTLRCALDAAAGAFDFFDVFNEAPWLLDQYENLINLDNRNEYSLIYKDLLKRLTSYVLSERELSVIQYRYGDENREPMTLEEIGNIYGVTRERIRQIEFKALKKISEFLSGVDLENYWLAIDKASLQYQKNFSNNPVLIATQKQDVLSDFFGEMVELQSVRSQDRKQKSEGMNALHLANLRKIDKSSKSQIVKVEWALEKLRQVEISEQIVNIARIRIDNPSASLSELSDLFADPKITKDVIAGRIRRLIRRAEIVSGEKSPGSIL